ncbi:MAG: RNA polymerase sigma factor [Bacteroidota bacterium]
MQNSPLEQEIIQELQEGEPTQATYIQIVREYKERIYWHIRKMVVDHDDADDVTQETFIKVWKNLKSFRGDSALYTWIYRIATNECLSFLKKRKRTTISSIDQEETGQMDRLVAENFSPSGDEIQLLLEKATQRLPEKQRQVFLLKYYDELKFSEIAEITDTSVGALKANYHHAVKKIEDFINTN